MDDMDTSELRKWVDENDVINRTFEGFRYCFNNSLSEEPEEFERYFGHYEENKLKAFFHKVELKFVNRKYIDPINEDREFLEAYLRIEYNGEYLGYYSLLFDFNGDTFDDFLVWEWEKWYIFQRLDILNELKEEFTERVIKYGNSKNSENLFMKLIDEEIDKTKRDINSSDEG
jgi:hypothetical protein